MGTPTSVRVAPDGRIFVLDLYGSIKIFTPGVGFGPTPFGSVEVNATGDRGLLGATFDRDFATNPYLYVHYVGADSKVRIGRFVASGPTSGGFTVLYTAPIVSEFQHAGGGITMGLDGMLYFGIGDSGTPNNSQDLTKPNGKIHRIARDGTVPNTNPNWNTAGALPTIYAMGVRNPFRLHTDSTNGSVYVGDVGFNTWEEINKVLSGKNYGWPIQEGPCTSACAYENPMYWYPHQFGTNNTNDASIVAGPVYRGTLYPVAYRGKMFVSDYVQGFLRTIDPAVSSNTFSTFSTDNGPAIDLDVGPDGKLYFVTISSPTLYRIDYTGGTVNQAPIAQASANPLVGASPLTVNFSSVGSSDPEGAPLSYVWNFGDGSTSTLANPTKIYTVQGQYTVQLTVSDGVQSTPASSLSVKVGVPPTVSIALPTSATTYAGGETIQYQASAVDSTGATIPQNKMKTTVNLYHSDHSHPFVGPIAGSVGSITAPTTGEVSPDVWLRVTVEATDSIGLTGSSWVEIHPRTATLTLTTVPAGLSLTWDGKTDPAPIVVTGVAGMTRTVAAVSPQTFGGKDYVFTGWSDGKAREHTLSFPETNTTLTATFATTTTPPPPTPTQNLLKNPSFEDGAGSTPTFWTFSRWGTNDGVLNMVTDAIDGAKSVRLSMTTWQSGEGRFYHSPVDITPGQAYRFSYQHKSSAPTKMVADVLRIDGTHQYLWFGINPVSTNWREQVWNFTAPANARTVTVSYYLVSPGFLQIDAAGLFASSSVSTPPPTVPVPTLSLSVGTSTLQVGSSTVLSWSASGTAVTCTASGAWGGAKALSGSETMSPTQTSTYTLTCTNSGGPVSKSVTITVVQPSQPPTTTNMVPNPSALTVPAGATIPLYWYRGSWGSNTPVFSTPFGRTDERSFGIALSNYVSGDAKWFFAPVAVVPGKTYTYSYWYTSTGRSDALVEYTLADGTRAYSWLGQLPVASTWTAVTRTIVVPANVVRLTVQNILKAGGNLTVDDVSLLER